MEGNKIETNLAYFKFNANPNSRTARIEWYFYEDSNDENGTRPFTQDEEKQFLHYTVTNQTNFPGTKEYHTINSDESPIIDPLELVEDDRVIEPSFLMLSAKPELNRGKKTAECMQILLTNANGTNNHTYNLPFKAIGKILGWDTFRL